MPRLLHAASSVLLALSLGAQAQERVIHALGDFEMTPATGGILVGAPHGTSDVNTPQIALEAARLLGAGHLIARRFIHDRVRINVNRPTEGAFLPCAEEARTSRASDVYSIYRGLARKAAGGQPLRLYLDVHGNSKPEAAQYLDIAAKGISAADARRVKEAFPALLAKVRARNPGYPEIGILIQPVDRVVHTAGCTKQIGIMGEDFVPRSLHFEFPRSAREPDNQPGSAELAAGIARLVLEER